MKHQQDHRIGGGRDGFRGPGGGLACPLSVSPCLCEPDKGGLGQHLPWVLASSLSFSVANRTRPCRNTASAAEAQCQLENSVPVGAWCLCVAPPVGPAFLGGCLRVRTGPAASPPSCSVCHSSGRGVFAKRSWHLQRPRGKRTCTALLPWSCLSLDSWADGC